MNWGGNRELFRWWVPCTHQGKAQPVIRTKRQVSISPSPEPKGRSTDSDTGQLFASSSHPLQAEQLQAEIPNSTEVVLSSQKRVPTSKPRLPLHQGLSLLICPHINNAHQISDLKEIETSIPDSANLVGKQSRKDCPLLCTTTRNAWNCLPPERAHLAPGRRGS